MTEHKNRSIIKSILDMTCPRCRKGDLFYTPTFSFQKSFDMPKKCDHCAQRYVLEPGFYYGAMFISYIITAFFCLITLGIFMLLLKINVWKSFGILIFICAILFVWFFRISRSIWIHMRVKYNPKTRNL